ncbi:MAG: hypothetical protein JWO12_3243, partial [Frankiales bacterium]|nr:hypothetical protein [Frankiales bacterium]
MIRRRSQLLASLASLVTTGLLVSGVPAQATSLQDAKRAATALRVKVDALRQQAEVATEDYDEAYARLGKAVNDHLAAERALGEAEQASGATDETINKRVRALYMSGGSAALYAHVLSSSTITEVANRLDQVQVVIQGDKRANVAANRTLAGREAAERTLAATAAQQTKLQQVVSARADQVRTLLAQTDALLAAADQRVRDIADAQRRAAEAAAEAR